MVHELVTALAAIPILVVARFFTLHIPYTNSGFFCDDDEIRYPDRPSSISSNTMTLIYGIITLIMVPISEYSLVRRIQQQLEHVEIRRFRIHPYLVKTTFFYAAYTCGVLATSVSTNIFKRTSSRLRPNFMALCRPANLDQLCPLGSNAFIEDFICLGESSPDQHFSFPSSHSSQSLFFAVYTILYLHHRLRLAPIIRAFAQFGIFLLSVFICLSRVRDFKHRYADVMGGGILGITIAVSMIHLILFNFRPHRYRAAVVDTASEISAVVARSTTAPARKLHHHHHHHNTKQHLLPGTRDVSPNTSDYGSIV